MFEVVERRACYAVRPIYTSGIIVEGGVMMAIMTSFDKPLTQVMKKTSMNYIIIIIIIIDNNNNN